MPIMRVKGGQSPPETRTRQPSLDIGIFCDIFVVIDIEELIAAVPDRSIGSQGQDGDAQGCPCCVPKTVSERYPFHKVSQVCSSSTTCGGRHADAEQMLLAAEKQAILGHSRR